MRPPQPILLSMYIQNVDRQVVHIKAKSFHKLLLNCFSPTQNKENRSREISQYKLINITKSKIKFRKNSLPTCDIGR